MPSDATPTDGELDLLKCFWREGELSAREVQARIVDDLGWSASTTRTMLERMRAKGMLSRRNAHGIAVYSPTQPKVQVVRALMGRLATLLEIEGPLPAAAFSGSQLLDADDIAALEAALAEADAGDRS